MDSTTIAHLLRSDLLPLSYVPERPMRLNRELLRYRASLVKVQTGIKNKVHNILAKNNIVICPPKTGPVLMLDWRLRKGDINGQEVEHSRADHK